MQRPWDGILHPFSPVLAFHRPDRFEDRPPRIDRLTRLDGRGVDRQIERRRRALRPILHHPEGCGRSSETNSRSLAV